MILSAISPADSVGDRALQTFPQAVPSMLICYLDSSSSKWIISSLICLISQNPGGLLTFIFGSGGADLPVSVWFTFIHRHLYFSFLERPVLNQPVLTGSTFVISILLLIHWEAGYPVSINNLQAAPKPCRHLCFEDSSLCSSGLDCRLLQSWSWRMGFKHQQSQQLSLQVGSKQYRQGIFALAQKECLESHWGLFPWE